MAGVKRDRETIITKTDLARDMQKRYEGINLPLAKSIVNDLFDIMRGHLKEGKDISVQRFGRIYTRPFKSNTIKVNPSSPNNIDPNGERKIINVKTIRFKAGSFLKRFINSGEQENG